MISTNSLLPIEVGEATPPKNNTDFNNMEFDLSPDTSLGKLIITIHGEKGGGKTTAGFIITTGRIGGFPNGKTYAISFDNKTKITRNQYFPNEDITVWNGKKYYREDPFICTESGMKSYKYLQNLIQSWQSNPPDWIMFDGFTIMALIMEMAMRYKNNLQPSEGTANRNVWKDRARFIQDLHNLACSAAKFGVMYTTYSDKLDVVEAGTTVTKENIPKYTNVVMQETDVVLHATKQMTSTGDLFYLRVESTKYRVYLDEKGKSIPVIPTTLSQGRLFNISKLADMPSPTKINEIKFIEPPMEIKSEPPIIKITEAKPLDEVKPLAETKPTEVYKPAELKKEYLVPNPINL